jgi:exodeoxyribonuclease VII large subunit
VVPEWDLVRQGLAQIRLRMEEPIRRRIAFNREQLRHLAARPVLARPFQMVHDRSRRLDDLDNRARRAIRNRLSENQNKVRRLAAGLSALSPLAVLARGYSVTQRGDDLSVVKRIDQVAIGDEIQTQVGDGKISSRVTSTTGQ